MTTYMKDEGGTRRRHKLPSDSSIAKRYLTRNKDIVRSLIKYPSVTSPKVLVEIPALRLLSTAVRRGSCYTTRNTAQKFAMGTGTTNSNSKKSGRDEPSLASQAKTSTSELEPSKELLARYEVAVRRAALSLTKPGKTRLEGNRNKIMRQHETVPRFARTLSDELVERQETYATRLEISEKKDKKTALVLTHRINSLCALKEQERKHAKKDVKTSPTSLIKTLTSRIEPDSTLSQRPHIAKLCEKLKKLSQPDSSAKSGISSSCKLSLLKGRLKKTVGELVRKNRELAGENKMLRGEIAKLRLVVKQQRIHV